jgi:6-phosphogluconate dehydrogenase
MSPDILQFGVPGVLLVVLGVAGRIMTLLNNERLATQKRLDDLQETLRVDGREDAVRAYQMTTMLTSLIDYAKSLKGQKDD